MSDAPHAGAEEIAYRLFVNIARSENKNIGGGSGTETPNREWILETYAECLYTVQNPGLKKKPR